MISPSFDVIKWLGFKYRQRGRLVWTEDNGIVTITCPPMGLQYSALISQHGITKTYSDIAIEAYAYFMSRFVLIDSTPQMRTHDLDVQLLIQEIMVDLHHAPNWIKIPPCYRGNNPVMNKTACLKPVVGMVRFVQLYDLAYLNKFGLGLQWRELVEYVFLKPVHAYWETSLHLKSGEWNATRDHTGRIFSLRHLCMRKLSTYNRAFGGSQFGPNVLVSTDRLGEDGKYAHMMCKYGKDTAVVHNKTLEHAQVMTMAYPMLIQLNEWNKFKQSVVFTFTIVLLWYAGVSLESSSGTRSGTTSVRVLNGIPLITTVRGKKAEQMRYSMLDVQRLADEFRETGTMTQRDTFSTIYAKYEKFSAFGVKDSAAWKKKAMKCREFFILFLTMNLIAYLVHGQRLKFERGGMICVGMKWFRGGAWEFAKKISCNFHDGMIYGDADIDGYDTSVNRYLLEFCSMHSLYYIHPDSPDYDMYEAFLELAAKNLSVKTTLLFGKIWRVIIGTMPSGALETSHFNSWIYAFLWCCYACDVMIKNPHRAQDIWRLIYVVRMMIVVYGDDHVFPSHESIADIFNIYGFEQYLLVNWKMVMRDIRWRIPLISVPDNATGGVKLDGVVFLKRRLIKRPPDWPDYLPDILPYKVWDDTWIKLVWGNTTRLTYADVSVAACGLAWDSMGTNSRIHEFCDRMYKFGMNSGQYETHADIIDAYLAEIRNDEGIIDRLLRKMSLTVDQLRAGFPSIKTLMEMHRHDPIYCDYRHEVKTGFGI